MESKETYMSVPQVAKILGVLTTTVYGYINKGYLLATDLHHGYQALTRSFRIAKSDFDAYMEDKERYLTVPQVANILGVSHATVRQYINKGYLPATDIHRGHQALTRSFRIAKSDFDAFKKNKETYLTVAQVAKILGVSKQGVHHYINKGYLQPAGKSGGSRTKGFPCPRKHAYITKTDLDLFLQKLKAKKLTKIPVDKLLAETLAMTT